MSVKLAAILAGAVVLSAHIGFAETTLGKELAELTFAQIDANSDQNADREELKAMAASVFASMDADASGSVSVAEFQAWDFGFVNIAEDAGKLEGFGTAQKIVFDLWERDNDQQLTLEEMKSAMEREVAYADINSDGEVSKDEFLMGFSINIAYRAAIKTE